MFIGLAEAPSATMQAPAELAASGIWSDKNVLKVNGRLPSCTFRSLR